MLNKYEATKLQNDLKILIRFIKVVCDENNDKKREYAQLLAEDVGNQILNDIDEMTDGFNLPIEYNGSNKLNNLEIIKEN